jgi:hypothetical protein
LLQGPNHVLEMITTKRFCRECNEEIHGRRDKLFCTDYCRASFHNSANADAISLIRRVNNKISKNRRILAGFNPTGQTRVKKQKLVESGLDFNYYTNTHKSPQGQLVYFCYDQGYHETGNQFITIIANDRLPE